jgi:hypothetical protein
MNKHERNLQVLAPIDDGNANAQHIARRRAERVEWRRKLTVILKHFFQDMRKALTNAELYMEDWRFHNGPITTENQRQAIADCIDRVVSQHNTKAAMEEDAEFRAMQGPLAEFADVDGGLLDFAGDDHFERMALEQNPDLRQYKK